MSAIPVVWPAIALTSQGGHSVALLQSSGESERSRSRKRVYSVSASRIATSRSMRGRRGPVSVGVGWVVFIGSSSSVVVRVRLR